MFYTQNWAFGLYSLSRTYLWIVFWALYMGFPLVAFTFFFWVFVWYFGEERHDILTFDEFFDNYLAGIDPRIAEDIEKMFTQEGEIRASYQESGRELPSEYVTYTDSNTKSNDFDESRFMSTWDTPYSEFLTEVVENAHDEWNYIADMEVEAGIGLTLDELEYQYLYFLKRGRNDPDYQALTNKHVMVNSFKVANSGVMSNPYHCNMKVLQKNPRPSDIRIFLYHKDDFHSRYWSTVAKRKLLNKNS